VADLVVEEMIGLGMATVMARKGVTGAAIGAALGVTPPTGPGTESTNDLTMIGTGPESWLVVKTNATPDFANELSEMLADLASVSDQSGSYAVTQLSGPHARKLLQRGAAIDFHPDCFRAGSAATTLIAHIGVIIWQVDDRPTYHVATFRSYAASLQHWLSVTIAAL
jgi:heterotetrameric sarcosine oxidase gamma subunit